MCLENVSFPSCRARRPHAHKRCRFAVSLLDGRAVPAASRVISRRSIYNKIVHPFFLYAFHNSGVISRAPNRDHSKRALIQIRAATAGVGNLFESKDIANLNPRREKMHTLCRRRLVLSRQQLPFDAILWLIYLCIFSDEIPHIEPSPLLHARWRCGSWPE